jgi:PPOX class probable F420-dependent enzyme
MADALNDFDLDLLRSKNFAHLATIAGDGAPHVTVTWVDTDGTHVVINSAAGRVKDRHILADPRVNVSVHDQRDGYRFVSIRGVVAERVTGDEAEKGIDFLNRKYHDDEPWMYKEGQVRVLYRIRPERILRYNDD